ncbi:unnamed protein product [Cuscuta campestris]|uniref:WRKY domain-containing protein n=1 Tax=Cuscuta campestris TaxID=132261 RepID=A0A484KQQ4_9ASTE|nr:unnamed protein product [Cuscuta campestris]
MGRECIEEDKKKKNNNWGLQAIVHPQPPPMATTTTTTTTHDDLFFHNPNNNFFDVSQVTTFGGGDDDVFVGFSSSNDALLEELYKPFYHHHMPNSSPSIYLSTREHEPEDRDDSGDHKMKGCYDESSPPKTPKSSPKYKKRNRKNEHNRVVIEVEAEELCKDKWAWRKYGQKPIKGSPYPRSYYRCSSSKGCLARKQVERSNSKAGTRFVVTYTAEHSHSQPTRRNSLAGTIRNKFIILPPPPPPAPTAAASSSSSNATTAAATPPRLPIPPSVSDPLSSSKMEPERVKMEENVGEDFFAGLEDLEGLLSQVVESPLTIVCPSTILSSRSVGASDKGFRLS